MAEVQVTDNNEILPPLPFDIDSVKVFKDAAEGWWILRDATTNDIIELAPGVEAKFPIDWPP